MKLDLLSAPNAHRNVVSNVANRDEVGKRFIYCRALIIPPSIGRPTPVT
jgi:hypothetical protein